MRLDMLKLVIAALTVCSVHSGLTPTSRFNYTSCGENQPPEPSRQSRIIAGTYAAKNEFPWQMTFVHQGKLCGGTLITDRCIITAGHCIDDGQLNGDFAGKFGVYGGLHDRKDKEDPGVQFRIIDKVARWHARDQDFANNKLKHDIAVLTVTEPFEITESVNPACLPTLGYSYTGEKGMTSGHGLLGKGLGTSQVLQKTSLTVGSCGGKENQICAKAGLTGTAPGDSGGPLVVAGPDNKYSLVGVVSFGRKRPRPKDYFMRVTWYMDYIKENCHIA